MTLAALEHRFRDSQPAAQYVRAIRMLRFGGGSELPTMAQRRALRRQLRSGLGVARAVARAVGAAAALDARVGVAPARGLNSH